MNRRELVRDVSETNKNGRIAFSQLEFLFFCYFKLFLFIIFFTIFRILNILKIRRDRCVETDVE